MRLNLSKKIVTLAALFCFAMPSFASSAEITEGSKSTKITEGLKATIDGMLLIIKNESEKKVRREKLENIIDEKFDYIEMAKRTLSKNWNARTKEERREFTKVFRDLLVNTYITKIERYTDEKVEYLGEKIGKKGRATVKTLIVRKEDGIPVDYRLLNKRGKWVVYDFLIESVSLIRNYRSQFGRIIKKSSYEDLMERMKTKVKELKEKDETTEASEAPSTFAEM